MGLKVTNNAFGTLSAGISNSDVTITLEAGQGARFPTLGAGDYFYATLIDVSNNLEIVKVTARSTDSMTVVRAQDGTTARAYSANDRFELRPTAALFNEKANVDDLGTAAAADVVTSDTDVTAERLLTTAAGPAQAFRRGNILGTVSESSGVPTGAIIERGSNANGAFVKFADGTMILTSTVSINLASSSVQTFSYPATPSSSASSSPAGISVRDNPTGAVYDAIGAASIASRNDSLWGIKLNGSFLATGTRTCPVFLIGRWY